MSGCFKGEQENTKKLDAVQLKQTKKASGEKGQNVTLECNKLVRLFIILSDNSMNLFCKKKIIND